MHELLENAILDALYKYYQAHFGAPQITFSELYDAIGVSIDDIRRVAEVRYKLFSLQNIQGWIKYQSFEDGTGGTIEIRPEGVKVVEDRYKHIMSRDLAPADLPKSDLVTEIVVSCPTRLQELAQLNRECARLIEREEILNHIVESLANKIHFLVLYGQPMVGKTRMLMHISELLIDQYVPLSVTGQGFSAFDSLDNFAFDFADQLNVKFRKWARRFNISAKLEPPTRTDFDHGNGLRAFYNHWNDILQAIDTRQPLVIFDEIERLLDEPSQLNPRIITFLDDFMRNPENGCFIIAGSERIYNLNNDLFSMLIAKGESIRIGHYDDKALFTVFYAIDNHIVCDDVVIQSLAYLCDGHPRLLKLVFETTVFWATRSMRKERLEIRDIDAIVNKILEQSQSCLYALRNRLSQEEFFVTWLISKRMTDIGLELKLSLQELLNLLSEYAVYTSIDREGIRRGLAYLEEREWIEWDNRSEGIFRFKLGMFPLWLHRRAVQYDEAR